MLLSSFWKNICGNWHLVFVKPKMGELNKWYKWMWEQSVYAGNAGGGGCGRCGGGRGGSVGRHIVTTSESTVWLVSGAHFRPVWYITVNVCMLCCHLSISLQITRKNNIIIFLATIIFFSRLPIINNDNMSAACFVCCKKCVRMWQTVKCSRSTLADTAHTQDVHLSQKFTSCLSPSSSLSLTHSLSQLLSARNPLMCFLSDQEVFLYLQL